LGKRRERLLNQFVADVPVPAASATLQRDHDSLARCVQRLKERERTVVVMTFFD
jgi:DNA-directed RNA polymerase specialized sigma24 family protein